MERQVNQVRLIRTYHRLAFAWLDSKGAGLPIEYHKRAWRPFTYRVPA
jgi:hypothetical protein